ncbi:MAG: hypothetical protein V4537_03040 [Pseudomonadota bacterium]
MSLLSVRLSRALERGRAPRVTPRTRADLLRVLLNKRAAAHNAGADDLETLLRDQILWSLPIERHTTP